MGVPKFIHGAECVSAGGKCSFAGVVSVYKRTEDFRVRIYLVLKKYLQSLIEDISISKLDT
jgi:hypothetical protein